MRVLVGGGTGFVGRALTQLLRSRGHEVTHVSRQGGKDRISWEELSHSGLPLCDAVVNLAGENVLNPFRRWSDAFCREVISSRVETTKTLAKAIADAEQPPRAWVLVTGVGYYRPSPTAEYTEDSPGGDFDFFSRLVSSWEAAALIPGSPARGVVVRSGVVLGRDGGAISQMLWPFRLGLGGPLGSGLQPFPWIHIRDLAGIVCHALEKAVFNQKVKMRKSGILSKCCIRRGLFQRRIWFFHSYSNVKLETATVNVTIQDLVADVVAELFFRNVEPYSLETMFIFPVDSNTVVHSFYATMGDTRIEAILCEKEEAQQLCKATAGMENLRYLQDQCDLWGPVFACFLGTLPPNREVTISLCYVQELPLQPDGAAQFCWPHALLPERNFFSWMSSEEEKSENLHFNICLKSACGVSHVAINSSHTPLQYTAPDQTSAEVSLKSSPWMYSDLNVLVYYRGPHTLSAVVERGDPKAPPGSLLGDPVVMVTLKPDIPEEVPNPGQPGEFLFLMDRSLFQDAQNTLLFLLKSLPLGCYFNIYSFGATFNAFYPQSVEYTQESMDNAVGHISSICPDLGGCDLLGLLRSIYSTPHLHGHGRQLFIFIQRKISSEEEAVMAEVYRYRDHHRCFCFPTNSCHSFKLSQAMALETKGECVCLHSKMDMTSEAVKCLQRALQPVASGISLHWDLPPGLEVSMIRKAPEVIFQGHQISIYAQIRGQAQDAEVGEGSVTLQYHVGSQSFDYTLRFSLSPSSDSRLPVHRMAMMHLLWKLACEGTSRAEKDIQHSAVKSSLSLGVPSPFTSNVAVRMKQRDAWQCDSLPPDSSMLVSPSCNLVPCQLLWLRGFQPVWFKSTKFWVVQKCQFCLEMLGHKAPDTEALTQLSASCKEQEPSPEEQLMEEPPAFDTSWDWTISPLSTRLCDLSRLRVVVALQKANGSWALTAALASALGLSKADVEGQRPSKGVQPTAWATVLALVWLYQYKWKVSWLELLEDKACRWLHDQAEVPLDECLEAAKSLLGCFVELTVFRT